MLVFWRPTNYVCHYGIKGQKWGIRRFQNEDGSLKAAGEGRYDKTSGSKKPKAGSNKKANFEFADKKFHKSDIKIKTKNGDALTISEEKTPKLAALIAKHSPRVREELERSKVCTITDKNGKRVGDLEVYKESKDSMNVVWVGIDDAHRGKGYATAVMKTASKFAKENGCKQITLEVPGDSPDARHIYEKQGFVAGEQLSSDDVWGGLTKMTKKLR